MRIEKIEPRRGKLYALTFEDGTMQTVDRRTFDETGWRVDSELGERERQWLCEESDRRRVREKALYLLSVQDRSRGELEQKLRREWGEEAARETAAQMEEWGLINDGDYAGRLAQDLRRVKHLSARQAVQGLRRRGIDRDLAESAVAAVPTTDLEEALALLQKKRYNDLSDEMVQRRAAALLARYGFDYETSRRALREVRENG